MAVVSVIKKIITGKPVFGLPRVFLEIGMDWVKCSRSGSFWLGGRSGVKSLARIALPEAREEGSHALAALLRQLHLRRKPVVLLLPRQLVTVRLLKVPSANPDEISRMVRLQVGRQTPYSTEEVVSAYRVLHTDAQGYSHILLVIARRSIIAEQMEAVRAAGMKLARIGITSEAVWHWFLRTFAGHDYLNRTVALLDVDSRSSDLLIFHKGKLTFTRSLLFGARNQAADQASGGGQAEMLKEVQESLERYRNENPEDGVGLLLVGGSLDAVAALTPVFTDALRVQVVACDPLAATAPNYSGLDAVRRSSFTAVLGAALEPEKVELDLIPPEEKMERAMEEKRVQLNLLGLLAITLISVISLTIFVNLHYKNLKVQAIEAAIAEIKPAADSVNEMKSRMELINRRLDARSAPLNMIAEIHRITPPEIQVTSLRMVAAGQVGITGRGSAMADVFRYVEVIERSDLFQGVTAPYTSVKKIDNREYAEFRISCLYEPAKPQAANENSGDQ